MSLAQAVLSTLIYHDIFDYPLTLEEIHQYLILERSGNPAALQRVINILIKKKKISSKNNLYFIRGRAKIVEVRQSRSKYSKTKLKRAALFAKLLKLIPSIKLVAISGALAMENSPSNDDIDLVIVTTKNSLWTTRFLANLLLLPFKRSPKNNFSKNKACLNLFIDESQLEISPQNLYIAHEVCQMKPLWGRDKTYSHFLNKNKWSKKFLSNWQPKQIEESRGLLKINSRPLSNFLYIFEVLARNFQLLYMRKKITTERVGRNQLFFHPSGTQDLVLKKYLERLKKYA